MTTIKDCPVLFHSKIPSPVHCISGYAIILTFHLSSCSNTSLSAPALYKDNTFQVPTNKSFDFVIIHLPLHFPCLFPINCLALSLWCCMKVMFFTRWDHHQPQSQPQTQRTRVSLSVWVFKFDVPSMGGPNSGDSTASTALRIPQPCKLHHYVKVGIHSVGITILKLLKIP